MFLDLYLRSGLPLKWVESNGLFKAPKRAVIISLLSNMMWCQIRNVLICSVCCLLLLPPVLIRSLLRCWFWIGKTGHEMMTGMLSWLSLAFFPLEEEAILWLNAWCIFRRHKCFRRSNFTYIQGSNKWVPGHQSGGGCWVEVGRVGNWHQNAPQACNRQGT